MESNEPHDQVIQMIAGYWSTQAVYVAAKLRIADQLAESPKSAAQLAAATNTHERALYRVLRALASTGVFREREDGCFELTPQGECLRSDVEGSQWALAVMSGEEQYRAFGDLLHSVRTGEIAFDHCIGEPIFEFLSKNEEQAAVFDRAMTSVHGRETDPMIEAYDFSRFETIVDVGGGNGTVIAAVLKSAPQTRGILYDLPHVIERSSENLVALGVDDRCELHAGSFFDAVPAGGDAYVMRHIIHDWDDDKACTILRNCHSAMQPDGTLLVFDSVIDPGNEPDPAKFLDLAMLVIPGGLERTENEFRALFASAGFELTRILPTPVGLSLIEGRKLA